MNYRHAFHAGNFADLVKHALVLAVLKALQDDPRPLAVIDTHAGAGLYDLTDENQARSKEAEAGIARLLGMDAPPELAALARAVRNRNPGRGPEVYPGSPVLIAERLRPGDSYEGCELDGETAADLVRALAPWPQARALTCDGYAHVAGAAKRAGRQFVLIDPPFERPDDYVRCAETAATVAKASPGATIAIWTPLKDMETFDGFLRRLEAAGMRDALVAEARLRPLTNPMKMNGCAVVTVNPPPGLTAAAAAVCDWVARELGEVGGKGEVWRL